MRQWRLIYDPPAAGAWNMAVDEAILLAVSTGQAPPTLRLYGWSPLCLSLGYGQRVAEADLMRIDAHGWQIVRRPTGGRAILHGDELTYSVALPDQHPLAQGDIIASYRRLSEALLCMLHQLGLAPASEKQTQRPRSVGPVCFEVPSHYEITADGRKLIGSAQVRRRQGILQHGSLPLVGDLGRICEALAYPDEATRQQAAADVRQRATTLAAAAGRVMDWQTAAVALAEGFRITFDLEWLPGGLTEAETQTAHTLLAEVYAQPQWTMKR